MGSKQTKPWEEMTDLEKATEMYLDGAAYAMRRRYSEAAKRFEIAYEYVQDSGYLVYAWLCLDRCILDRSDDKLRLEKKSNFDKTKLDKYIISVGDYKRSLPSYVMSADPYVSDKRYIETVRVLGLAR